MEKEKKGKLKNCKVFGTGGRLLKELSAKVVILDTVILNTVLWNKILSTERSIPITVIGINDEENLIYREGIYYTKTKIFQTTIRKDNSFIKEEYEIESIFFMDFKAGTEKVIKFNFFSAIGDEIEEGFFEWARLIYYKDTHPKDMEKTIVITGQSFETGSSISRFHITLNDVFERGFYYKTEEAYVIWPSAYPIYDPRFFPAD